MIYIFFSPGSLQTAEVLCQNVTFAEHYTFIWKDKNIERINVTVFLGSLCDGGIMKFLLRLFYFIFFNSVWKCCDGICYLLILLKNNFPWTLERKFVGLITINLYYFEYSFTNEGWKFVSYIKHPFC